MFLWVGAWKITAIGLSLLALLFKRNQNADTQESISVLPAWGEMCMGKYDDKPCSSAGEDFLFTKQCSLVVADHIQSLCCSTEPAKRKVQRPSI